MKKILVLLLIACMIFTGCGSGSSDDNNSKTKTAESNIDETESEIQESQNSTPEGKEIEELTYGSTFQFDDMEITIGKDIEWSVVENEFSDKNGSEVIRIPANLKNISDETKSLNMFYIRLFGSKGTQLDTVSAYFDSDIVDEPDMRSGAEVDGFFHLLYDGDGDYYIEFDNFSEKLEVKLPISK